MLLLLLPSIARIEFPIANDEARTRRILAHFPAALLHICVVVVALIIIIMGILFLLFIPSHALLLFHDEVNLIQCSSPIETNAFFYHCHVI